MTTTPLNRFPVAHTVSPGNLQSAVASLTNYDHTVVRSSALATLQPISARGSVNGVLFGDLSLVFVAYASHVKVYAPPTRNKVVLVIPLGPMTVEVHGRQETMTSPFLLSASADSVMYPDPVAGSLVGSIPVSHLTATLSEAFGEHREFVIDLTEHRPIPVGSAVALKRTWLEFAAAPETENTSNLVDSMLVSLAPYTKYRTSKLSATSTSTASRSTPPNYLVHATRYMVNHISEPLSLASIAELTGISARQLQLAFRAHLGCTAQEYLRRIRLERAHHLLTQPGSFGRKSVVEVSAEVGIPHQSRFAQYFNERFGVLPSTLVNEVQRSR